MHVGAGLHELGGQPEGLRGRVLILEASRIGHEGDVQRLGDGGGHAHAELREEVAQDLPGRRGVGDDQVQGTEARVVVVVVDVHDELSALHDSRVGPEPPVVRAVQRKQDSI